MARCRSTVRTSGCTGRRLCSPRTPRGARRLRGLAANLEAGPRALTTSPKYGWVVVAAAFTLMTVGFAAAYSFAAFFSGFESEFGASRGHIALVFSVAAFIWFLL